LGARLTGKIDSLTNALTILHLVALIRWPDRLNGGEQVDIDEYQRAAHKTARSDDLEVFTLGLFGEAGSVATTIKKLKRDNEAAEVVKQEIATELGDVLWYLAELASAHDLRLSDIAQKNLDKAAFLFSGSDSFFDEDAPEHERLPRNGSYEFVDDGERVTIIFEGKEFGDPLDDNAHDPDGYRFHDVFHLAYMTVLGWSPVVRKLLGRKRKEPLLTVRPVSLHPAKRPGTRSAVPSARLLR
jgi:NTP pyrophosphatase (non-canonical NTP hydrolase)